MTKEDLELLKLIKTQLCNHKYKITLLAGAVLKRDIETNEIELIAASEDEYEELSMQYDEFHCVDLFCLESWDEIENGTIDETSNGPVRRDDAPEKKWLLLAMHPECKTAKQAWKKEHDEYEAYINSGAKVATPPPYSGPVVDIPIKQTISIDTPEAPTPKPELKQKTQKEIDEIRLAIERDFPDTTEYSW